MPKKSWKVCNICQLNKSFGDFYNSKATKDGKTYKCKDCTKEYSRKYKQDNSEAIEAYLKEYGKRHYRENREKKLAWQKDYRERNLDYRRAYDREQSKRHYENNKDTYLEKSAARRAQKLQAMPSWVDKEHRKRLRSIYKACRNTSKRTGKQHHVDHIIPLNGENVCGLHVWWNLRIVSAQENLSKGNKVELF